VVEQQPDLGALLVQPRQRQRVETLTERRPRDRLGVDLVGLAGPRRDWPISLGATRTTRSPAPTSARSRRPETWRQSSIAHVRSRPKPRAHRSATS
jgi:hypothetical protein